MQRFCDYGKAGDMTANGFPYFQFHIDRWQAGKISAFDLEEQGLFLHLCILGWVSLGAFNICSTTVQRRYRKPADWVDATVKAFLDVGIIERDGDKYRIKFIDEQVELLTGKRQQRVDAGKASAAKRAAALLSSVDNTESRVEKRREEKSSTLNERSTTVQQPLLLKLPKKKQMDLAEPCFKSEPFIKAWQDWQEHRREIKKPLTPKASESQMAEFKAWGESRAVAAIRHTIKMGWQGIREQDAAQQHPSKPGYTIGLNQ